MTKLIFIPIIIVPLIWLNTFAVCAQGTINTIAGNGTYGYSGDGGPATAAQLDGPAGLTFDTSGNLFFADIGNSCIRKINTSGIVTTVAGNGTAGYSGDGGMATAAELNNPNNVSVDRSGNLYIPDATSMVIRKVNTSGIITTIAGNGTNGYSGDGGPATLAQLSGPVRVAADIDGNIYIADNANYRIRKVNTSGIITTLAGNGTFGSGGDGGPATGAELSYPSDIAVDTSGNVYVADNLNSRVRKVNASGIITTIAGNGTCGFGGDGGSATVALIGSMLFLAADNNGNVFIIDSSRVRKINSTGLINTIAGTGAYGFGGDGGPSTAALFNYPYGIAVDGTGNIYVGDDANSRIRKISNPSTLIMTNNISAPSFSAYPNPAGNFIYIFIPVPKGTILIVDITGKQVTEKQVSSTLTSFDTHALPRGTYFAVWLDGSGRRTTQKIVIE